MLSIHSENKNSLTFIFFIFFFIEVCIGGAGTLLSFGPITLRKANFILAFLIMLSLYFFYKQINRKVIYITFSHLILILLSTIIGYIHYGNNEKVSENLLGQSFFLLLPFYALFINSKERIKLVIKILQASAVFLAIVYLVLLLLILLGVFEFLEVYDFISNTDEIMGRGESAFWYKGFLYLCTGIYFFDIVENVFFKRLMQMIIFSAIILTFTRGFLLAIFVTSFIYYLFYKNFFKGILLALIGILLILQFKDSFEQNSFNRQESDQIRVIQLGQVKNRIMPYSIFIGHGFGEGVPIRDNHMEINYLSIFHKQGILGLFFWLMIFILIILQYNKIKSDPVIEKIAKPFLLSSMFVFFQSATNPFITNSIGMNIIMVSIVSLEVLAGNNQIQVKA